MADRQQQYIVWCSNEIAAHYRKLPHQDNMIHIYHIILMRQFLLIVHLAIHDFNTALRFCSYQHLFILMMSNKTTEMGVSFLKENREKICVAHIHRVKYLGNNGFWEHMKMKEDIFYHVSWREYGKNIWIYQSQQQRPE